MKNMNTAVWIAIAAVFALQGCAHDTAEKRLDQKLVQEPPVLSRDELRARTDLMIKTSTNLSDDQRQRLTALLRSTRSEADELREKSLKLRALLIENTLSAHYDPKQVELTKSNLKESEAERLRLFFKAVGDANTILGRAASRRQENDDDFLNKMMYEMTDFYWN